MNNGTENKTIPPFVEEAPPLAQVKAIRTARLGMMLVGAGALSISILGGAKLLWEILIEGPPAIDMLGAKLLWVAIPFVLGWIVSLIDIRALNNLILPLIIRFFMWVTLFGILAIYVRTINRLYTEAFFARHYLHYSLVFIAGFALLVSLHLLIEDQDLRSYSLPILFMTLTHLLVAVLHYVFQDGDPAFAMGDVVYFIFMLCMFILMSLHLGLLNPLRRIINSLFERSK